MKISGWFIFLFLLAIGMYGQTNSNAGFELSSPGSYTSGGGVSEWNIESRTADGVCSYSNWTAGSSEFSLVATPLIHWPYSGSPIGIVPHSPFGGTVVAQLNNGGPSNKMTRISYQYTVTSLTALFQFAFTAYLENGGTNHSCCQQPGLIANFYDHNGNRLSCVTMTLSTGSNCQSAGVAYTTAVNGDIWTNWGVRAIDFMPYVGTVMTIEFITTDCSNGCHYGTTLLDLKSGGQSMGYCLMPAYIAPTPVTNYCPNSTFATITAPPGYTAYEWISSSGFVALPQGSMQTLGITNPVSGSVYTVNLITSNGCMTQQTFILSPSLLSIIGIGADPSCPNGASGSATVVGGGSSLGYAYSWKNSSNTVVGTNSIVTGLSPGVYTVKVTGGQGYCGSDSAVVNIASQQNPPNYHFKPYCTEAYLCAPAGASGIKWYYNNTPLTGTAATLPCYTVTNPSNGMQFWLGYNQQGCRDSLRFTLVQIAPGSMTVPSSQIKPICLGANNGTAVINLLPANGAPPGFSTFSVMSTGTTPSYTAGLGPGSVNSFSLQGLSPGTYSVQGFDGACKYYTTFSVTPVLFSFSLSATNASLCPGQSKPAGVMFSAPPPINQYNYTWTPTTWLLGNNGSYQNTIIIPTISPGSSVTTIYTVAVSPTIAFCPQTKTLSITAFNPPTPTITPLIPLCNTFPAYQVTVAPGGGIFVNPPGNPGLISTNGLIQPSTVPPGISTFTYVASMYTCSARSTGTVDVSVFKSAALTGKSTFVCTTDSVLYLPGFAIDTLNSTWSGPYIDTQKNFRPRYLPLNTYALVHHQRSVPNPNACPDADTLLVTISNTFVPVITSVPPFCNNSPMLTTAATPTGGVWQGAAVSPQGVVTPSAFTQAGQYMISYSVTQGGCSALQTSTLDVNIFRPALLTSKKIDVCAFAGPVDLDPYANHPDQGQWTGTSTKGHYFDPSVLPTGNYDQVFTSYSDPSPLLCPDFATLTVSVLNPPQPHIIPAGPFCTNHSPVNLYVSPAEGQWTSSAYLDHLGLFDPRKTSPGKNVVQYVNGTPTCSAQQTLYVEIEEFVGADLLPLPTTICKDGKVLDLDDFAVHNGGTWSGPGINGTEFHPAEAPDGLNTLLYETHSMPTASLCPDSRTAHVKVVTLPDLLPLTSASKGCEPLEVLFNVPNVNTGEVTWIMGDGVRVEGAFTASHVYQYPGSYQANLLYVLEGCSTVISSGRPIEVLPSPIALFTVPQQAAVGATVQPVNETADPDEKSFIWQVEGSRVQHVVHPILQLPEKEGPCAITLVAIHPNGCRNEATQTISLKYNINIYIPNSFTPNYDKINDIFRPVFSPHSIDGSSYRMDIFNRWGEKLFSTEDPEKGWDGLDLNNSTPLLGGIYSYKIRYVDREGKAYSHTGYVNLIN